MRISTQSQKMHYVRLFVCYSIHSLLDLLEIANANKPFNIINLFNNYQSNIITIITL